jgi:hypothetical protein
MKLLFSDLWKFLTFRFRREDYERLGLRHLALGLAMTWLVGIARNWDLATATIPARLGLYSLSYVLVFSTVLWLMTRPFSGGDRGWVKTLTFVSLTAAPGLIYGIPVEMFLPAQTAQQVNLGFLLVVAAWRFSLAINFIKLGFDLEVHEVIAVLFTPVCFMIAGLLVTGRVNMALAVMGGVRDEGVQPLEASEQFLILLSAISFPGLAIGAVIYIITLVRFFRD